jgi:phenylacetate-CoA ligase
MPGQTTARLKKRQDAKLRKLVAYAYDHVDYYRQLLDQHGVRVEDIQTTADLVKIPLTKKTDLLGLPEERIVSRDNQLGKLKVEQSSGSTGTPFKVYMDRNYLFTRNLRFLRGLHSCGYRWPMKLLLITTGDGDKESSLMRWRYLSIKDSAETLFQQYRTYQPSVLYGCTTPLRLLAEYIEANDLPVATPRTVITTAESLDQYSRLLLMRVFSAPVCDFYGMTEMGLIGWRCSAQQGYHLAWDSIITELVDVAGSGESHLVFTNLDLYAMPLIRFDSGDIGSSLESGICTCRTSLDSLDRVEGRVVDTVSLKDGRQLSPYRFTCEMEKISSIKRYKVIQVDLYHFRVEAEITDAYDAGIGEKKEMHSLKRDVKNIKMQIKVIMLGILGKDIDVSVEILEKIPHVAGRKFRAVESAVEVKH